MDKQNITYLITTGLKQSWPKGNFQRNYLGSWCFNTLLDENDKIVFKHPWDNRELYFEDYKYISKLNETFLNNLSITFNKLNKVNKPKKYWRILLSPWLLSYITICLDHWRLINSIYTQPEIYRTIICKFNKDEMILNDMKDLKKLYLSNEWNHFLFCNIINFFNNNTNNKKIIHEYTESKINFNETHKFNFQNSIKLFFNKLLDKTYEGSNNIDHYFYNSYINNSFSKDLKKNIINSEFQNLNYDVKNLKKLKYNSNIRNKIKFEIKSNNNFEIFLLKTLHQQIPKIYLEGFNYLKDQSKKNFPYRINKTITTAVDHYSDDVFKYWAAEQNQLGVKLIINQHGGSFGMLKWYQFEDHSIEISDNFLTWGWSRGEKCYPLSASKLFDKKNFNSRKNREVLIVYFGINKFSISHDSVPLFTNLQRNGYENDQINLLKNLNTEIKKNLKIRLYPNTYGPNDMKLIKKYFSENIIDKNKNFYKSLENCKIFIGTYNSTTYLESIFYNFPTIIYWNEKYWELHNNSKKDFEMLKNLNIFHSSPKSLANFLNKIWPDISNWWYSKEVQHCVSKFRSKYIKPNYITRDKWMNFYNKN